tara:strand:- start:38035 stop:38826 length:792 start_codon:yes stop_codon:yes gene_type:complete
MSDDIILNVENGIALITLNRPDKLNAFHLNMIDNWIESFKKCVVDDSIKVIVITGRGKAFCAGGDIKELMGARSDLGPEARREELTQHVHKLVQSFLSTDKPIISAINGVATGAGLDLALYSDLRFAAESAKFAETYVNVGLIPGAGGAWMLPRIVGRSKALELFWTARFFDANEAKELRVINDIFSDEALLSKTMKIAQDLTEKPQSSIRAIKRAIIYGEQSDLPTALDHIASTYGVIASGSDHLEAINAFIEKRKPNFKEN